MFAVPEDDYNRIQQLVEQHWFSAIKNIDQISNDWDRNHTGKGKPGCFSVDVEVVGGGRNLGFMWFYWRKKFDKKTLYLILTNSCWSVGEWKPRRLNSRIILIKKKTPVVIKIFCKIDLILSY